MIAVLIIAIFTVMIRMILKTSNNKACLPFWNFFLILAICHNSVNLYNII